jgi:lipopolysaccharide biosynthesis protein
VADRMIRRAYLHKNKEAAAVRREIESVAQTVGQNLPLEVTSNKRHRDAEIEELKRRFPQIGFGHKPK